MELFNNTLVTEFVLKGFPGSQTVHISMFLTLFLVFLITLTGNLLIIIVICMDYRLHAPMYLFLVSLSFMEIIGVWTIVPKLLAILITGKNTISTAGCFTQSYFYFFVSTSDFLLLTVMSFDRYVAICHPLRYSTIMRNRVCALLVAGCMVTPFCTLLYTTLNIPVLPFCGTVLDHFFCDGAALLKLICADTRLIQMQTLILAALILNGCLLITVLSYFLIVRTVIRLSPDTGRQKTFSTCVSHLTMVSIVFGSAIFIEVRPPGHYSVETDKVVNLTSSLLSPLLNPFIYTLRNKKVKDCIRDALRKQIL